MLYFSMKKSIIKIIKTKTKINFIKVFNIDIFEATIKLWVSFKQLIALLFYNKEMRQWKLQN